MSKQAESDHLTWHFPLPRTHTGILIGNGIQGLMVWGETSLNITVARAGFWDHRGGNPFETRATFTSVRRLLEANDKDGIRDLFARPSDKTGLPTHPQQLGGGRLELTFGKGWRPVEGVLDRTRAVLTVRLAGPGKARASLIIRQAMDDEIAWIDLDATAAQLLKVKLIPTWEHVGEQLAKIGCQPPEMWGGRNSGGFCQSLPEDDPMALAWSRRNRRLLVATALGPEAAQLARQRVGTDTTPALARRADAWWKQYWKDVPRLHLPDPELQHAYDYGVYKQAGMTTPTGVPATLQGPWMEEYQIPPWSNDYHFNINAEMIYWPCLGTNRLDHLTPLWTLLKSWMPRMKTNGERFFGASDAIMLPHAVDDRCQVVGTFWAGTIDHACTAWMAQMAWQHYRYSMDESILRDIAWPMLNGTFNGFWAMLEEIEENGVKRLSLPVSVSPEYNGSEMNAWGRDSSFQLAALHATAALLQEAARVLSQPADPRWEEVRKRLPPYTLTAPSNGRIALWKGQDLATSHRHHSHLASIYPFCTIAPLSDEHRPVVARSLAHWTATGPGAWTGWCIPWAAILCARCGLPDAAVNWLHWWKMNFTNLGHGTLHNADFPGCSAWNDGALDQPDFRKAPWFREVMQMDAGMGAITAVLELLVQCRADGLYVVPRLPKHWFNLEFDGIRTEGAFLIGGTVRDGALSEIRITSLAGSSLDLVHGMVGAWKVNGKKRQGPRLTCKTRVGEKLVIRPS
jgi:alpha-L-fucosidase 2